MSTSQPEHTFVILAYKESEYLEGCVQSVLKQTIRGRAVIATSTPNKLISDIAQKYGLELKVNTHTGSIGRDWNFGLQCAGTRYAIIAHQDDVYLPDYAETCVNLANRYHGRKPLMVFTKSLTYIDDNEVYISYKNILRWLLIMPFHFKQCIRAKSLKKSILLFSNSISCPGVMYVKENMPGFGFDENCSFILDWQAWYDLSQMDGAFIYAPKALHIHREHKNSATSTIQSEILHKEEFGLLHKIWGNTFVPGLITRLLKLAK